MSGAKKGILVLGAIGVLLGLLLIFVPVGFLMKLIFIIMGVLTLFSAVPALILSAANLKQKGGVFGLVSSLLSCVMGVLLIFWHSAIVMILVGVYLVVFPLIRILVSPAKLPQFKAELPSMILGVAMILIGPANTLEILLDVAGVVVIALSVILSIVAIVKLSKLEKVEAMGTGSRIFVDLDGDGTPDRVYVDTTGDGEPDIDFTVDNKDE